MWQKNKVVEVKGRRTRKGKKYMSSDVQEKKENRGLSGATMAKENAKRVKRRV